MDLQPLYQRVAHHYRGAIRSGVLTPGARMPSVRSLTRLHQVSLSTALQACRSLEDEGLLEARPRSGYFVRAPRRAAIAPAHAGLMPWVSGSGVVAPTCASGRPAMSA